MKDGAVFALAGLTERWLSPEGEVLDSCTIVTTQANALLSPMHDRMPVIIAPSDYQRWLDTTVEDVFDLFAPYPAEAMAYYPVSWRVNAVRNDDASLIDEVPEASPPAEGDEEAPERPPEQTELF